MWTSELPAMADIGIAAVRLWCRNASWPTEPEIADEAAISLEQVFRQGAGLEVRHRLAHLEFEQFMTQYRQLRRSGQSARGALEMAARQRASGWHALDGCLVYLPLLSSITVRARTDHQRACALAAAEVLSGHSERIRACGAAS